jgi:hypothetical protein
MKFGYVPVPSRKALKLKRIIFLLFFEDELEETKIYEKVNI